MSSDNPYIQADLYLLDLVRRINDGQQWSPDEMEAEDVRANALLEQGPTNGNAVSEPGVWELRMKAHYAVLGLLKTHMDAAKATQGTSRQTSDQRR